VETGEGRSMEAPRGRPVEADEVDPQGRAVGGAHRGRPAWGGLGGDSVPRRPVVVSPHGGWAAAQGQ
jgi:hypothetical protein